MTGRRDVLAAVVGSVATGLAGCGYRPGGGDVRWSADQSLALSGATAVGVVGSQVIAVEHKSLDLSSSRGSMFDGAFVYGFGTESGTKRWEDELPAVVRVRALGDPTVVVTEDRVHGYGVDGERWQHDLDGAPLGVGSGGGRAYVLTDAGTLRSIRRGRQQWQLDVPVSDDRDPVVAADRGGVVYLGNGELRRVGPDGTEQWAHSGWSEVQNARIVGGVLYVSTSRRTTAIDVTSGQRQWDRHVKLDSIAATGRGIYGIEHGRVLALDHSGSKRWQFEELPSMENPEWVDFEAVAADGAGVYARTATSLVGLDPSTGGVRWDVTHERIHSGPFLAPTGVVVEVGDRLVCHYPVGT